MLSKNLLMSMTVVTLATSVFIGCQGNNSGAPATPIVNCLDVRNQANMTCINSRPGMAGAAARNQLYGTGYGRPLSVGSFSRNPPNFGFAPITITNSGIMMGLCYNATWYAGKDGRGGARVQRSAYDGRAGAAYADGYDLNNGNVQDIGYNPLCSSPFQVVISFEISQQQTQDGRAAYVAAWKFYFIPAGTPVNAQTDGEQLKYMGPGTTVMKGYLTGGPNGGFQAQSRGIIFGGVDNGNSLAISIGTPQGPIGNGVMSLSTN